MSKMFNSVANTYAGMVLRNDNGNCIENLGEEIISEMPLVLIFESIVVRELFSTLISVTSTLL